MPTDKIINRLLIHPVSFTSKVASIPSQTSWNAGDKVLLLSETSDFFLEAMLAIMHCGAIAVPISTRWTSQEICAAVQSCQPVSIFCEPAKAHLLEGHHDKTTMVLLVSLPGLLIWLACLTVKPADRGFVIQKHKLFCAPLTRLLPRRPLILQICSSRQDIQA